MAKIPKLWMVTQRYSRFIDGKSPDIRGKEVATYKDAVAIAKEWYKKHGIEYGIIISYYVSEICEHVKVRDYYLINSIEDIV
jgi:hypothetical protein